MIMVIFIIFARPHYLNKWRDTSIFYYVKHPNGKLLSRVSATNKAGYMANK